MKTRLLVLVLLMLGSVAGAQNYQGMSEADVQRMMQQMQKVQACMQQIDQSELQAMERRSRLMEAEIRKLCAAGKRVQAERKAMEFFKKMERDDTMQTMHECGQMMQDSMPAMPFAGQPKESDRQHVCD